jgi:hypothetical protein
MDRMHAGLGAGLALGAALLSSAAATSVWADGNVTAVVVDGELRLRGDPAGNAFSVILGSQPGTLEIGGFDGTTTTNGSPDGMVVSGVTALDAALRGGDDQLNLIDVHLPGRLRITTGSGDDAIGLDDSSGDDVDVNSGPGHDSFSFNSGAREFDLETGAGNDFAFIDGITVTDRATMNTGSGDDEMFLLVVTVEGRSDVMTRAGNDVVTVQDSTFEGFAEFNGGSGDDTFNEQEPPNDFNGGVAITNFETIQSIPE